MPESGSGTERLAELRRRLEEDPQSPVFLQLAEEHRRLGQTSQGLEVLEEGLRRNPNYLSAQIAQARCLLDLGRVSQAVPALEQVLSKDATQLVARKLLIDAFIRQGHPVRARRELDLYVTLNSSDPEIAEMRSRIEAVQLEDLVPPARLVASPNQRTISVADRLVPPPGAKEDPLANEMSHEEPFRGLSKPVGSAYLARQLAAEGIFVLGPGGEARGQTPHLPLVEIEEEDPPGVAAPPIEGSTLEVEPSVDTVGSTRSELMWLDSPLPASPQTPAATATLGQLYLSQGHLGEAEKIFREVLAFDPHSSAALQGLERAEELSADIAARDPVDRPREASRLPVEADPGSSAGILAERKVKALNRYLAGFRRPAGRHVP